ncbi:hypothetical protein MMC22_003276 [Lobaria immixta]|nr:hypothetical protein [Lobaria immixta]
MFLASPRDNVAAQINLLSRLKCKTMISPSPRPPPVTAILDAYELHSVLKTLTEVFSDPLFIVHPSGSTGIPKPLIYTHDTAARNMTMVSMDPPSGSISQDKMYQDKRVFMTFPPFHGACLFSHLFNAVPFDTVMIAPTSGEISTAQGLVDGLKKTPADIALIVLSIVRELS